MLRHGLDNVLILYDHCWDLFNMTVNDFNSAFITAMEFLNSVNLTEHPTVIREMIKRKRVMIKQEYGVSKRGNGKQQPRRSGRKKNNNNTNNRRNNRE